MVRLPQGWKHGVRPKSLDGSGIWPEENSSLPLESTVHEGWRVDEEPRRPASSPAEATAAFPAVGDILGGYRILGRLGAGGMGQVFRVGQRAFTGQSRTELVRAILDAEPSWSELPAELPAPVVDLLRRCLEKDAYLRPLMSHIRIVLEETLAGLPRSSGPAEVAPTTLEGDSTILGIDPTALGHHHRGYSQDNEAFVGAQHAAPLLDWARQKPVETIIVAGALIVVLGAGLGILGLGTERAREGLIGLPPLSYSKSDLVLTGVQSLWSLPWRAAASLAAPHPVLRGCAFAGLLLAAALLAGAWFLRRGRRGTLALTTLAFSAGVLIVGAWLYSAAVHTGLETPGPGRGLTCEEQLSLRWDVSAAFETCTWLVNDNPRNEERRQGVSGVLGFLILAAGGGVWMGARIKSLGPRGSWARWGLVAVHAALALFFLRLAPAAHAYSTWGVRYPPVTVRTDLPGCDRALGQALAAGSCCAFNVSEDATEGTVLLLWGSGCPGGGGFKAPEDVEAIGKGCLSQALTPQTVNSRCL